MMILKRDLPSLKMHKDFQAEGEKERIMQNLNVPMEFLSRVVQTLLRTPILIQRKLPQSNMSSNTSFRGLIPARVFKRSPLMRSVAKHSAFSSPPTAANSSI